MLWHAIKMANFIPLYIRLGEFNNKRHLQQQSICRKIYNVWLFESFVNDWKFDISINSIYFNKTHEFIFWTHIFDTQREIEKSSKRIEDNYVHLLHIIYLYEMKKTRTYEHHIWLVEWNNFAQQNIYIFIYLYRRKINILKILIVYLLPLFLQAGCESLTN